MSLKQASSEVILGIDPGTKVTGYGVIATAPLQLIDCGTITPKHHDLPSRYREIFKGLESLVLHFKPTALAVESQFMHKNFQSSIKLGMAKGMAFLISGLYDIPLFEYTPKEAKMSVTGTGSASKYQVGKMLEQIFNLKSGIAPEDASDAVSLALTHLHRNKRKECFSHV